MTLEEFFVLLSDKPVLILAYFSLIPLAAFIAGLLGKGEGNQSPWKYLYATLIYLVCIPGIFAVTLNIYLFLFEKQSIFQANVFTQILPVLSMIATLLLIRNNTNLEQIPGFGKLSGLVMMIATILGMGWIMDKTRLFVFSYLPFQYVFLIFIGMLLVLRLGWSKLMSPTAKT